MESYRGVRHDKPPAVELAVLNILVAIVDIDRFSVG
jgi:hypothetical protein